MLFTDNNPHNIQTETSFWSPPPWLNFLQWKGSPEEDEMKSRRVVGRARDVQKRHMRRAPPDCPI